MIMKNVIPLNLVATHIFDIKGSEQNRQVEKLHKFTRFENLSPHVVYKDLDFNYYIGRIHLKNAEMVR